jgi:hypothetical protein
MSAGSSRQLDSALAESRKTQMTPIVVYLLYGHYSFNPRDGGQPVRIVLSDGYSVADWLNGAKLVVGTRVAVSIEQAIHHGFACIVE